MKTRHLLLALFTITTADAVPWNTQIMAAGSEVVSVSSVTVDDAGRVHTVRINNVGLTSVLNYRLRTSGSGGFSDSDRVESFSATEVPIFLSIGVTDDYTVQIAAVDALRVVRVYERKQDSPTWTTTLVGGSASVDPEGGISLRSRGNGAPGSALVYAKQNSGASRGGVRYSPQDSDGGWAPVTDISNGADTGQAPTLLTTGLLLQPLMVVSYNAAEGRIEESSFTRNILAGTSGWRAPREIAPALTGSRPDAEIRNGIIGVSFVSDSTGLPVRVQYAELRPVAAPGSPVWTVEDVTPPTEVDTGSLESLGMRAALTLDASGSPWIAYARDISNDFGKNTLDIRARRRLPGIGWELSILDEPGGRPVGFHTSDCIHLASGENGDPALIYERDLGDVASALIFARPESAPWVIGRPATLADQSVTSSAALASGQDGALHLVSNIGNRGEVLGTPFATYRKPVVITYAEGEETREDLPSTLVNHHAHAATVTPDGTLHVLALRGRTEPRELVHFRRAPGGTFEVAPSAPGDGTATLAPVNLETSATGQLFCAYVRTDGRTTIQSLAPGASAWTSEATVPGSSVIGHNLAVRADGATALTYFEFSGAEEGIPKFFTNIDSTSGEKLSTYAATSLTGILPAPQNTACIIHPDGFPFYAWISQGRLTFGDLARTTSPAGREYPDGVVAMKLAGAEIHITAYTSEDGGSLRTLRIPATELPSTLPSSTVFATPGLPISTTGTLGEVPRVALPAAIGPYGFPIVAPTVVEPGSRGFYTTLVLARQADSLDDDGDRIPLLLEGAHCLDVRRKNPLSKTAQGNTTTEPDGSTNLFFTYSVPSIPGGLDLGRFQHGEFIYQYQFSSDLALWEDQVPHAGVTQLLRPLDLSSVCRSTLLGFRYSPAAMGITPRRFGRIAISRDR